jgi:hypothetical protein
MSDPAKVRPAQLAGRIAFFNLASLNEIVANTAGGDLRAEEGPVSDQQDRRDRPLSDASAGDPR